LCTTGLRGASGFGSGLALTRGAGGGGGAMVDSVLCEVELAPLPGHRRQDGFSCGLEPGVVVAGDEADAAHAALDQAVEELSPVDLGLADRHRRTEHAAPAVGVDADGGQQGHVDDHAAVADLLVAGVEDEVRHVAQRPVTPAVELFVERRGGAADLRGADVLQAQLGHDLLDVARADALDVHLCEGGDDGAAGARAAFEGLGIERLEVALTSGHGAGLGHVEREGADGRLEGLGLGAVGVGESLVGALVGIDAQGLLSLDEHGGVHEAGERGGDGVGAVADDELDEVFVCVRRDVMMVGVGHRFSMKVVEDFHDRAR